MNRDRGNRDFGRGFARIELALVCLLLLGAAVLFFAIAGKQRRSSQQTESLSNLRQIGALMGAYVADHNDVLPSYNWRTNVRYGSFISVSQTGAAANQATDILRRRFDPTFEVPSSWIPHVSSMQLILIDYARLSFPNPLFTSPGDAVAVSLARSPASLAQFSDIVSQPRHLARSSFVSSAAVYYGPDGLGDAPFRHAHYSQAQYQVPGRSERWNSMMPRSFTSFAFPSQKAYQFDRYDWFSRARPVHCSIGNARCGVLMMDGGAATRSLNEASAGAYTTSSTTTPYDEAPILYETSGAADSLNPIAPPGVPASGSARLEFTFRQQLGRDFGPQAP